MKSKENHVGRRSGSTVSIDAEVFRDFSGWIEEMGMSKHTILSKLVAWFMTQPEIVRHSIVRGFPPELSEHAAALLTNLADGIRGSSKSRR